jgi:hypothetical protein
LKNEKIGAIARDSELTDIQKIRQALADQKTTFAKSAEAITDFAKHLLSNPKISPVQK